MPEVKSPEIPTSRPSESASSPINLRDVSHRPILPQTSLENTLKGVSVSPNRDLPKALEPGHPNLLDKPFEPSADDVAKQVQKMRQEEEASKRLSLLEREVSVDRGSGGDVEQGFREARETGRLGEDIQVRVDPNEDSRVIHVGDSSGNEARMVLGQRGNRASWGEDIDLGDDPDEPAVPVAGAPAGPPPPSVPGNRPPAPPSPDSPEPGRGDFPANPEDIFNPEFKDDGRNWALEFTRKAAEINAIEDPVERDRREDEFLGYIRVLDRMAASDKFFGVGIDTMRIEKKLVDFDAAAIASIGARPTPGGGVVTVEARRIEFESLLDELDTLEYKKKALEGALEDFKDEDLADLPMSEKSEYDRRKRELAERDRELAGVERQVLSMGVGRDFITERRALKTLIDGELADLSKKQEVGSMSELKDEEPSKLEKELEALLLVDRPPSIDIKSPNQIPKYEEIKNLKESDKVTIKGVEGAPDQEVTVREIKEWYFFNARELGFLDSVNTSLTRVFSEERRSIVDPRAPQAEGAATRILRLASADNIELYENELSWGVSVTRLEMRSGMDEDQAKEYVEHFKGVKGDFLTRGVKQAGTILELFGSIRVENEEAKKADLQVELEQLLQRFRERRLSGEFDVAKAEDGLRRSSEAAIDREEERPYTYRWNQYELTGTNREGVERSAEAAVNDLLAGSAAYDVNAMIQRMAAISEAIQIRGDAVIQPTETETKEEQIDYLKRNISNRISFHLGEYFGAMVQMDSFAGIMQKWAGEDGYERLRVIPTMIGGLAGKALELRYRPEYQLSLRPEGWSGQLYKNQLTQRYIRGNIEELMAEDLMRYELRGETEDERYRARMDLQGRMTQEKFDRSFVITGHPRDAMQKTKKDYKEHLDFLEANRDSIMANPNWETLNTLKRLRTEYNVARKRYVDKRAESRAAVDFSKKVMDSFLESSKIGAPSIRMHNKTIDGKPTEIDINGRKIEIKGDDMSIEDITSILEYVVMQEAKRLQGVLLHEYGIDMPDTGALLRWRFRRFLDGKEERKEDEVEVLVVQEDGTKKKEIRNLNDIFGIVEGGHGHGGDHGKARGGHHNAGHHDSKGDLKLRKGFEDTGLTNSEFVALVKAFQELKKGGFKTKFEFKDAQGNVRTKSVQEILKEMEDLSPVLNHYIAVDIYGSDILLHPELDKASKQGTQPFIKNLQNRLGWFGYNDLIPDLPKLTVSEQRERLEQIVENGRSFHDMVTQMVYYLGTRSDVNEVLDPKNFHEITANTDIKGTDEAALHQKHFGVKGIYEDLTRYDDQDFIFGFPNITLGHKRIKYINANWILRKQERVARGITMLPFMRIFVPSVSEDLGGRNILEVIWNMDKEYFDQPWMMGFGARLKNAVDFRKRGETSINGENLRTEWGFFDKLLVDAENLRSLFGGEEQIALAIRGAAKGRLHGAGAEKAVEGVIAVLGRYVPMLQLMDKTLSYDRDAGGSGASDESLQKVTLKFLAWMLTEGGESRRMQGGVKAHADVESILKFMLQSTSYRHAFHNNEVTQFVRQGDKSLWERVWEKIKPRTPGVSYKVSLPQAVLK